MRSVNLILGVHSVNTHSSKNVLKLLLKACTRQHYRKTDCGSDLTRITPLRYTHQHKETMQMF